MGPIFVLGPASSLYCLVIFWDWSLVNFCRHAGHHKSPYHTVHVEGIDNPPVCDVTTVTAAGILKTNLVMSLVCSTNMPMLTKLRYGLVQSP